jgi:hypothetical protein
VVDLDTVVVGGEFLVLVGYAGSPTPHYREKGGGMMRIRLGRGDFVGNPCAKRLKKRVQLGIYRKYG